jgi:hypothetical protein
MSHWYRGILRCLFKRIDVANAQTSQNDRPCLCIRFNLELRAKEGF